MTSPMESVEETRFLGNNPFPVVTIRNPTRRGFFSDLPPLFAG